MRFVNAVIHTIENGTIEKGFLEIKNGKIIRVGEMDELRDGDISLRGAHILPGFVDAHTCLGLKEDSMRYEGNDWIEAGGVLSPQLCPWDGFNPEDRAVKYALQGGVTAVGVASGNVNLIGSQVSAVKLCKTSVNRMLVNRCCAVKFSLGDSAKSKTGPHTRMAEMAMLRGILREARAAVDAGRDDFRLRSLIALLRGEIPAFIHAGRADDIVSAVRLSREFGFKAVIVHGYDAPLVAEYLLENQIPVIAGSLIMTPANFESRNQDIDLPAKLAARGVDFAITTDHHQSPIQMLSVSAALAAHEGLDKDAALEAITLKPARLLGLGEHIGSLKAGKDADFQIWSGHPFDYKSRLLRVFVNGEEQEI